VVGAGNSGAEIAFEVSRTHPIYLSGKPSGQIPVMDPLRRGSSSPWCGPSAITCSYCVQMQRITEPLRHGG
jgi:hypothetical protein